MKRVWILIVMGMMSMMTYAQEHHVLVAYFSATGNTERAAQLVAEATGGTLHEITPVEAYTSNDLNWHDENSRSSVEMNDAKARPGIVKNLFGAAADYDVVYLGYPIWWNQAPRVINTFLETYDFSGKTIIPFATSGGSSIDNSAKELQKAYPGIKWGKGQLLNRATADKIKTFINQ